MAMKAQRGRQASFGSRLLTGLGHAAKLAGSLHTAYTVGRTLYDVGSAVAPLAAAALL